MAYRLEPHGFKGFIFDSGTAGSLLIQPTSKQQLRQQLRAQRRQLSHSQQQKAAQGLVRSLEQLPAFLHSQHIALYLTNDGEISTQALIRTLRERGKILYLPVIHPWQKGQQYFAHWPEHLPLARNRLGILEPPLGHSRLIPARLLQLICMPLVAFDEQGNRLGMGGGFYDRSLAFMQEPLGNRPTLVGLAYELQKLPQLPTEAWDQPLDAIATEMRLYLPTAP